MSWPDTRAPRVLDAADVIRTCVSESGASRSPPQLQIEVPRVRPAEWAANGSPGPKTPASARRGCRFPSLDEAHRNITGRSHTSTSTASNRIASNDSSTEAKSATSSWQPARSSKTSATLHCTSDNRDCLSPVKEATSDSHGNAPRVSKREPVLYNHEETALTHSARKDPDDPFVVREDSSPLPMPKHRSTDSPSTVSESQSTTTVDRDYRQYRSAASDQGTSSSPGVDATLDTTPFRGAPRSSSLDRLSPANLSALRSGAGARCGFRPDDVLHSPEISRTGSVRFTHEGDQGSDGSSAVNKDPLWSATATSHDDRALFSLPHIPTLAFFDAPIGTSTHSARSHAISCGLSFSTLSDSQALLNSDLSSNGGLIPPPLALSTRARPSEIPRAHLSVGAFSMGATTESDDDPFKYDKTNYGVFLVDKREREVSARLQRQSSSSKHSRTPSCSPSKSLYKTFKLPSPIPEHPSGKADDSARVNRDQLAVLQFLHPDAIKSLWEVNQSQGATIRVPVPLQTDALCQPSAATKTKKSSKVSKIQFRGAREPLNDRDEWETVGTFQAVNDSSPTYALPNPPSKFTHDASVNYTGSSVADVSDEDVSLYEAQFDEYGSKERIIQHPSNQVDNQPFKVRHLKDSNIPVFVPKQRVHRVNGLAQNSIRLLQGSTAQSKEINPTESSRTGKILNPFSALNKKYRDKLLPLPPRVTAETSRFEFRDSVCSTDKENPFDGKQFGDQRVHDDSNSHDALNDCVTNHHNSQASTDYDLSTLSALSNGSHSFAFPLIPLPEAARLQTIRRESGIDDEAFASNKGRQRKQSFASLGKNRGSAVATSNLPRLPQTVHKRTPTPLFSSVVNDKELESRALRFDGPATSPISSKIDSPPDSRSHFCDNSTATFGASPLKNRMAGMWPSRRSEIPHLYPWDERRLQPGSDPYLRALADRDKLPSAHLTYTSHEGRRKQRRWFVLMLAVSIFPFLSVLVYLGKFDTALSWYTRGEVNGLTISQRRIILAIMVFQFFVWTAIIVIVVKKMGGAF
ncbi:uncharacterized protein PpBr36_05581 [Pyricularia pennisetigena]|uniref:uncharacterized protein n=1 Tax=Pyricularia pennisetigena TaxID=1578925 RepID=UPI001153AACC|nr:uncharacterized protein PpBr36_05581 [Pyricularia pennisetigena]TLS23094.1 hypothetical protein PpBr36_05581 [Pyricularia pennisetigena]